MIRDKIILHKRHTDVEVIMYPDAICFMHPINTPGGTAAGTSVHCGAASVDVNETTEEIENLIGSSTNDAMDKVNESIGKLEDVLGGEAGSPFKNLFGGLSKLAEKK